MLRMTGVFGRALNSLERQRVHLGESGLSSSDVTLAARAGPRGVMRAVARGASGESRAAVRHPAGDAGRRRIRVARAGAAKSRGQHPAAPARGTRNPAYRGRAVELLSEFLGTLQGIAEETPLADAVVGGGFGRAAYRLSLLALVGDAQSEAFAGRWRSWRACRLRSPCPMSAAQSAAMKWES